MLPLTNVKVFTEHAKEGTSVSPSMASCMGFVCFYGMNQSIFNVISLFLVLTQCFPQAFIDYLHIVMGMIQLRKTSELCVQLNVNV